MRTISLAMVFLVSVVAAASAQAPADQRFSVGLTGGLATGTHQSGAALGAALSAKMTPRLDAELETTYADRGPGMDALAFEGRLQIALMPRTGRVVPQITVGAGAYHASFDLNDRMMFGQFSQMRGVSFSPYSGVSGGMMGSGPYGGMWGGSYGSRGSVWIGSNGTPFNMPQMPMFYARRMGDVSIPASGMMARRSFTDPAAIFGGGVTLNASDRIYVRPEARALMVFGGGDTYTLGFFTLRVGFRF